MSSTSFKPSIGYYTEEGLTSVINTLDDLYIQLVDKGYTFKITPLELARKLTNKYVPDAKVLLWAKRLLRIYHHEDIKEAFISKKISSRFAFDMGNYANQGKYQLLIREACIGNLTNAAFRRQLKQIK